MQKVLTILLSVYILVLAAVPCADTAEPDPHDTALTEIHTHADSSDSWHLDCSPFCVCVCCGIVISIEELPRFTAFEPHPNFSHNFPLHTSFQRGYHHSILQPPQPV